MPRLSFTVIVEHRKEVPILHNQVKAAFPKDTYVDLEDSQGREFPVKMFGSSRTYKSDGANPSAMNYVEVNFYTKQKAPWTVLQELLEWFAKDVTVTDALVFEDLYDNGFITYELGPDGLLHAKDKREAY